MTTMPVGRERRTQRHLLARSRILEAAWMLARERGLAGWSLRDVAVEVGMRAPSLYVYYDSKNALFDAMFADGYRQLLARIDNTPTDGDHLQVLRRAAHLSFDFSVEDPARHQLLFLRTIPGFSPSADSFALAETVMARLTDVLRAAGVGSAAQVDLWTALFTGLASQQISNDPGGHRWDQRVDDAVSLVAGAHFSGHRATGCDHIEKTQRAGRSTSGSV